MQSLSWQGATRRFSQHQCRGKRAPTFENNSYRILSRGWGIIVTTVDVFCNECIACRKRSWFLLCLTLGVHVALFTLCSFGLSSGVVKALGSFDSETNQSLHLKIVKFSLFGPPLFSSIIACLIIYIVTVAVGLPILLDMVSMVHVLLWFLLSDTFLCNNVKLIGFLFQGVRAPNRATFFCHSIVPLVFIFIALFLDPTDRSLPLYAKYYFLSSLISASSWRPSVLEYPVATFERELQKRRLARMQREICKSSYRQCGLRV